MLRSLKNSLKSGKKGTSSSPKEEAQAVVSTSKQQSSSSSKQPAQPAKQQGQPVKEKPPLPVISEQNLQLYYADPLPSFREWPTMRQGRQCLRTHPAADLHGPAPIFGQYGGCMAGQGASLLQGHPGEQSGAALRPGRACRHPITAAHLLLLLLFVPCRRCAPLREAAAVCAEAAPLLLHV